MPITVTDGVLTRPQDDPRRTLEFRTEAQAVNAHERAFSPTRHDCALWLASGCSARDDDRRSCAAAVDVPRRGLVDAPNRIRADVLAGHAPN